MARITNPVLFGRKMKRLRTYGFQDLFVLNAAEFSFTVWRERSDSWRGTAKLSIVEIARSEHASSARVTKLLESSVRAFSRKLSKLTNSQEGDEVR